MESQAATDVIMQRVRKKRERIANEACKTFASRREFRSLPEGPFMRISRSKWVKVCSMAAAVSFVNFNQGVGKWLLLGTAENPRYIEETNATNGAVIVDAVRFERLAP